MTTATDIYLRLSDFRDDSEGFAGRKARLRAEAARLGWAVARVVVENDAMANGDGKMRPASAFKRKRVRTPSGRFEMRVIRPGFRSVLDDLMAGRVQAVLAEDLDRTARDPRDLEDLIDACEANGASARSLSGSLTLTNGGTDGEITMARMMVAVANKSSRDTARRVSASRERHAEAGAYGGGRRPFGYAPDPHAPAHAKTLTVVAAEAEELRKAAGAVLAGVSLRALARDLRDRAVPTVTGTRWTPDTLRGCLLKPAIAGLAAHSKVVKVNGSEPKTVTTLHTASWPAILPRDTWEAVAGKLTDPSRTTNPGVEPRWLVSGIATCGLCGEKVYARAVGAGRPGYVCRGPSQHLRRTAPETDAHVAAMIIARLSLPDAADLLRPAPRPGIDAKALRTEQATLRERKAAQVRMHADGLIDDADLATGLKHIRTRLETITATLAANSAPDPLAEFRGQDDARAVWDGLPLARKREVVRLLATVTILPAPRGRGFDPSYVRVAEAA